MGHKPVGSAISLDLSARFIERTPWVLLPLPSPCLRYRVIVTQCDDLQGGTMTDETERDQKTKASLPTPDSGVAAVPKDAFMTVPADPRVQTPDAAQARLSWDGSGISAKEHIDYE